MRVDPFFVSNLGANLNQTQATQQNLTEELSSGLRINSIGQDPVAAAQNVQLLNQIQRDDSFTQTNNLTQGVLQVTDSALGSVVSQLNQALSLATRGNNGTLNSSDLKAISNQLATIRDQVLNLANSSYQGKYIFAGSKSDSVPFSLNTSQPVATVTYSGDSNTESLSTPGGQTVALNIPGDQIFSQPGTNMFTTLNSLVADFASGSPGSAVTDTAALNDALNFVGQQRVTLDGSITRLSAASSSASAESLQLTAVQTNLMQADIPSISTQLSMVQSQQTALISVISALGSGTLFDKM